MSMKVNKSEFMFGEKAGELQRQLEEETGVKWTIERIGTVEKYEAARSEELVAIGERCSLCKKQLYGYENYCPECGAKFECRIEEEVVSE